MIARYRIGIVGCGEVTQILHLPSLRELETHFEIRALCDIDADVLARLGAEWPGARRHANHRDLVRDPDVDIVLVANPHVFHAEAAIAAMEAGKHVLIEKPMCLTLAEADALLAAERRAGVLVQVGFMRRHAPAFIEAVALVGARRDDIRFARVHTVIGRNALMIEGTSRVIRGQAPPQGLSDDGRALMRARIIEAIGPVDDDKATAYTMLAGLSSHDTSAMRELIGMPGRVLYCAYRQGGRVISAAFDYGHFVCQFETGVDTIPRFDSCLEVYTSCDVIRVDYATPYIRHQPATLTHLRAVPPGGVETLSRMPSRIDSFVLEWRAFHRHLTERTPPRNSIRDAREDLVLFRDMMAVANRAPG